MFYVKIVRNLSIIITALLLSSCPAPLDPGTLALLQDLEAPKIILTSPADYSEYATVIMLEGSVTDESILNAPAGSELSAAYSIPGTSIAGIAEVSLPEGKFSTMIDVSNLDGDKLLEVSITDLNGNSAAVSVNIRKPEGGGDIAGFLVIPENKQVLISWTPVPGADSYSIYESYFGIEKTGITGSSYTWSGLENGKKYSFQLTAVLPEAVGEDSISASVTKMPLSASTLTPRITSSAYKTVAIEWAAIENIDEYVVERGINPGGPWKIRSIATGNTFTDDRVEHGSCYYYRVAPSAFRDIPSSYCSGTTVRFGNYESYYKSMSDNIYGLDIYNGRAYIAWDTDGIAEIDVSSPRSPGSVIINNITGRPRDVCIVNGIAYIANYADGLAVFDINASTDIAYEDTLDYANAVAVTGNYACLALGSNGLGLSYIFDYGNPAAPAYEDTAGYAWDIAAAGNYAYIADGASGLAVIDISNKTNPATAVQIATGGNAVGIDIADSYAYISDSSSGLAVVDITPPVTPAASVYTEAVPGASGNDIAVYGSKAYVSYYHPSAPDGLAVFDITDPADPGAPFLIETTGTPDDIVINGDFAYMTADWTGLIALNIVVPTGPELIDTLNTSGRAYDLEVSNGHLFIADNYGGLAVVDVADPENPGIIISSDSTGDTSAIVVSGNYAYMASGGYGLKIIDVSDPDNPKAPVYVDTAGSAEDVEVFGDYAFIADGDSGLAVVDIADPSTPGEPVYMDTAGSAREIAVTDSWAFLAEGDNANGLAVIDISDPENPGTPVYKNTNYVFDVAVAGDYVYFANGDGTNENAVGVMKISDMPAATSIYRTALSNDARSLCIAGSYVFVTDSMGNAFSIDITSPETPGTAAELDTSGTINAVEGPYAFSSAGTPGVYIYKLW